MRWKHADRSIDKMPHFSTELNRPEFIQFKRRTSHDVIHKESPLIVINDQLTSVYSSSTDQPFSQGNIAGYTDTYICIFCSSLCWFIDFLRAQNANTERKKKERSIAHITVYCNRKAVQVWTASRIQLTGKTLNRYCCKRIRDQDDAFIKEQSPTDTLILHPLKLMYRS